MRPSGMPPIRPVPETLPAQGEVARVRRLYLASLRRRVRSGSYLTPERVRTAMERLFQSLADDRRPADDLEG